MLTQLQVQNFKSWQDTGPLEIAPLTGLFGTNSSGKTSIMQALLMLKQTVESTDRRRVLHLGDERSPVDLGTFYDIIYNHEAESDLQLRLSWELPKTLVIRDPEKNRRLFDIERLSFTTSIYQDAGLSVRDFAYCFEDQRFGMVRKESSNSRQREEYDLISDGYSARRTKGRGWPLPAPVKCYGFPDEATGYYQNTGFLPDFVLAFEDLFSSIAYLGPLREYPKRTYVWAGESPVDVGRRGELAIPALLASQSWGQDKKISPGYGKRRRTVEERIGEWMQEMGIIHSYTLDQIAEHRKEYELRVATKPGGAKVAITDVGFGVSQILPVLVLCYYVPEGSTILLEQPEIHLHPSVQATLADVLIDAVKNKKVQIIVESHSEHLLTRLQRRIAEEVIAPDQTALYFCRMDGGKSQI
ncbi:MAG: AAA family ATPase, partial [Anaerolineae bacterium]|nr:AAA family ATPase [Anaerolineae bacterium]